MLRTILMCKLEGVHTELLDYKGEAVMGYRYSQTEEVINISYTHTSCQVQNCFGSSSQDMLSSKKDVKIISACLFILLSIL